MHTWSDIFIYNSSTEVNFEKKLTDCNKRDATNFILRVSGADSAIKRVSA